MTGAMRTEQPIPASVRARTTSSRRSGAGVPGSTVRHSSRSVKPTETETPTSATSAARRSRSRSRRISVPLVRMENGFARSRRAEMIPGMSRYFPLRPLVAVDVRPHGDVLAPPVPGGQLALEQLGGVGLDDDLRVEPDACVQVQIAVGLAGEAVHAGVRAAPVGVHRPFERHPRGPGHPVQDRTGPDLVEGDAPEFGGVERARGHRVRGEERAVPGRRVLLDQIVPAHGRLLGCTPRRIEHVFT